MLFSLNITGQSYFGIKSGLNASEQNFNLIQSLSGVNIESTAVANANSGVFLDIQLSEVISFQPELLFSTSKAKIGFDVLNINLCFFIFTRGNTLYFFKDSIESSSRFKPRHFCQGIDIILLIFF